MLAVDTIGNFALNSLQEKIELAIEMLKSFGFIGLELTMTRYNKAGKTGENE